MLAPAPLVEPLLGGLRFFPDIKLNVFTVLTADIKLQIIRFKKKKNLICLQNKDQSFKFLTLIKLKTFSRTLFCLHFQVRRYFISFWRRGRE